MMTDLRSATASSRGRTPDKRKKTQVLQGKVVKNIREIFSGRSNRFVFGRHLPDHVDSSRETKLRRKTSGVHDVEFRVEQGNLTQDFGRDEGLECLDALNRVLHGTNARVEEEGSTSLQEAHDIKLIGLYIALVVASHVSGLSVFNAERSADLGTWRKPQVRDGPTTRLLSIVFKIGLHRHFLVIVANHLDGFLVGADRSVATESPKDTLRDIFGKCIDGPTQGERQVGDIIRDTDGEGVLDISHILAEHVANDGVYHPRRKVLATKTVTTSGDENVVSSLCH